VQVSGDGGAVGTDGIDKSKKPVVPCEQEVRSKSWKTVRWIRRRRTSLHAAYQFSTGTPMSTGPSKP